MKRHKTWTKKLTAKERKHIKENFAGLRISRERIQATIKFQTDNNISCWECRSIARKAGLTI